MIIYSMQLQKLCKKLYRDGLCNCFYHYWSRTKQIIFTKFFLGRWDVRIYPDSRLVGLEYMDIGQEFEAGRGLWLETVTEYSRACQVFSPKLIIGNRVCVGEYVHIGCNHRIVIGDDVLMGSKIYITDHNHGVYRGDDVDSPAIPPSARRLTEGESVKIGARCWIGEFVTILPGVTIGEGSIIGSHSTVTHDIPANSIAVGSPARVVKVWDEDTRQWRKI